MHTLLDLVENVGGSKKATELFEKYVAREDDGPLYDARAAADGDDGRGDEGDEPA